MSHSNKYLKDKNNNTISPYTGSDNIIFSDSITLTNKISTILVSISEIDNSKANKEQITQLQTLITSLDNKKVDSSLYIRDIESIISRITALELDDGNSGSGGEIPPNIVAMLEEIRNDISILKEKVKYKSDVPSTVDIGGIKKGFTSSGVDINTLIYNMLHPYISPSVSISTSISNLNEEGIELSNSIINVDIKPVSSPIRKIELYSNGVLKESKTYSSNNISSLTDSFMIKTINADSSFHLLAHDSSVTKSNTIDIKFTKPIYIGSYTDDSITENSIKSLTKRVTLPCDQSYIYTTSNSSMCFAYPKTFKVSVITDLNGFNITSSFAKTSLTINGADYYVLMSNKTTIRDFKVTFNLREV